MRSQRRLASLGVAAVLLLVAVFAVFAIAPRAQDQAYHLFADTARLGPVPNALNVLSNVAFLAVGLWGLTAVLAARAAGAFDEPWEARPWSLFFAAIAATAFGSAWYHAAPDDARLFWDRLPMTVAFSSLVAAVLAERVDARAGRRLLVPLVGAGVAAILAWRFFGDLRPYISLQAFSILVVLAALFLPSRHPHGRWLAGLVAGYAAALLFEIFDRQVKATLGFTGGHPLKHLAAAAGTACLVWMIRRRSQLRPPGIRAAF
ncbi:MAG: alkaline phytoceramidase [Thermoanaerobaculia bacterium]|nr:alkaline phytoceramidase [Thermoanaerobaculia bacterium]